MLDGGGALHHRHAAARAAGGERRRRGLGHPGDRHRHLQPGAGNRSVRPVRRAGGGVRGASHAGPVVHPRWTSVRRAPAGARPGGATPSQPGSRADAASRGGGCRSDPLPKRDHLPLPGRDPRAVGSPARWSAAPAATSSSDIPRPSGSSTTTSTWSCSAAPSSTSGPRRMDRLSPAPPGRRLARGGGRPRRAWLRSAGR